MPSRCHFCESTDDLNLKNGARLYHSVHVITVMFPPQGWLCPQLVPWILFCIISQRSLLVLRPYRFLPWFWWLASKPKLRIVIMIFCLKGDLSSFLSLRETPRITVAVQISSELQENVRVGAVIYLCVQCKTHSVPIERALALQQRSLSLGRRQAFGEPVTCLTCVATC